MDIPKELQKIILNICDDQTRRLARLACREWFNIVDYREFEIYLTKHSEWPKIVDRLSSYTKPISLNFRKNIMKSLKDINEHLLRLTNLTDLSFDELDEDESDVEAEWLKLTALPNLHSVTVANHDYNIPLEAITSLQHLTSFNLPWSSKEVDKEMIIRAIKQWTKLQSLSIGLDHDLEVNLFERPYSTMTYLSIYLPDVAHSTAENWFQNVGNLKELQFSVRNHKGDDISLRSLTSLESICFAGGQIHELNSTKLTFLELFQAQEQYIERAVDKLRNLKEFILDLDILGDESDSDDEQIEELAADEGANNNDIGDDNDNNRQEEPIGADDDNEIEPLEENESSSETDDSLHVNPRQRYSYQWLAALTSLEYLNIDPMEGDGLSFAPTDLNKLQITICRPLDLSYFSRLTSLRELYIGTQNKKFQDLSAISQLTRLECLQIEVNNGDTELGFPLTIFTNLDWLKLKGCSAEISNLPKLERLIITPSPSSLLTGFTGLTSLTKLEFNHDWMTHSSTDYTYVSALTTLKSLSFHPRQTHYCSYFSTLTALDSLSIHQIASDEDYCYLSTLTKLTELRIWYGLPSEKILHLPTSLQRLEVDFSKPPGTVDIEGPDPYEDVDVTSLTQRLLKRLPNLYKYSFD